MQYISLIPRPHGLGMRLAIYLSHIKNSPSPTSRSSTHDEAMRMLDWPGGEGLRSISVAFEHCVLLGLSRKLCSASMTLTQSACMASRPLRIPGHVVSVKLHPQKVPAARGHAIRHVQTQWKSTVAARLDTFVSVYISRHCIHTFLCTCVYNVYNMYHCNFDMLMYSVAHVPTVLALCSCWITLLETTWLQLPQTPRPRPFTLRYTLCQYL